MPLNDRVGPQLVALGGVVVDDVQDHLEPAVVQARDHLLELAQRIRDVGGIARVGREEADRIVAPVVLEAACRAEWLSSMNVWTGSSSTVVTPSDLM